MVAEDVDCTAKEASEFLHSYLCHGAGHSKDEDCPPCNVEPVNVCTEAAEEEQKIELDDQNAQNGEVDTGSNGNKPFL